MPGAHFSIQKYIGSRLGLSAVWPIRLVDLLHGNIKGCCLQ